MARVNEFALYVNLGKLETSGELGLVSVSGPDYETAVDTVKLFFRCFFVVYDLCAVVSHQLMVYYKCTEFGWKLLGGKVVGAFWKEILLESRLYLECLEITVVQGIKVHLSQMR